jgi:hypothetical protein
VTRREILRAAALLLTPGALAGCEIRTGTDAEPNPAEGQGGAGGGGITKPEEEEEGDSTSILEFTLLRPWDLCTMRVRLEGMIWSQSQNQLTSISATPRIIFTFPPQHVVEQMFPTDPPFTGGAAPIFTALSGGSRVAVDVPPGELPMPFTEEALLRALAEFPMRLSPNAKLVPSGTMVVAEPAPNVTALEMTSRLTLSPLVTRGWVHTRQLSPPQGNSQRVELWHTRFTPANQGSLDTRRVRAIWHRPLASSGSPDLFNGDNAIPKDEHRRQIAEKSTVFPATPAPASIPFRNLMLTPLGGYLDVRGTWSGPGLVKWEQRTTLGRDQFVEVVVEGHLFPFGHRVLYTQIGERKPVGGYAPIELRRFITILEESRDFRGLTGGNLPARRGFPFDELRILTKVTPFLDTPNSSASGAPNGNVFVPRVDGAVFAFEVEGLDAEGRRIRFTAPAVFVTNIANTQQLQQAQNAYRGTAQAGLVPLAQGDRRSSLRGQRLALAPSSQRLPPQGQSPTAPGTRVDDGSFLVRDLLLADASLQPTGFMPRVESVTLELDAIRAIAGGNGVTRMRPHPLYLQHGFGPGNACEALLELDPAVAGSPPALSFDADSSRAGGFVNPSMTIRSVSRSLGASPIASPTAPSSFLPDSIFPDLNKIKLFGVFSLAQVIRVASTLAQVPQLVSQALDPVRGLLVELNQLRSLLDPWNGSPTSQVKSAITQAINELNAVTAATLNLPAVAGLGGVLAGPLLPPGEDRFAVRKQVEGLATRIRSSLPGQSALADFLELARRVKDGDLLESGLSARYVYRPGLRKFPDNNSPLFEPKDPDGGFSITAEARLKSPGRPGGFEVIAALENFDIHLLPQFPALTLNFQRLAFRVTDGKKPDLDVKFGGITFRGPLSFVERLKSFIPLDGFSDPPNLDISSEGVTAGFSLALPTVAVGMFSLSNVALSAAFRVPFVGDTPLSLRFGFASREQPFNLTVSLLGGGGFFGIELSPKGLVRLEAALEFGAAISINLGVASGAVSVMAGIYFTLGQSEEALLEGYLRLRGAVCVLGLITVSVEMYMALGWTQGKVYGRASISVSIEVLMFSKTVSISHERRFSGTNDDPTFEEIMGPYSAGDRVLPAGGSIPAGEWPWEEYVNAFAAEGA